MSKKEIECSNCCCSNRYYNMYKYKGEILCSDCLLETLKDDAHSDFNYSDVRMYYYDGESMGTDNEYSNDEIIKELIEYGEEIEKVEDE